MCTVQNWASAKTPLPCLLVLSRECGNEPKNPLQLNHKLGMICSHSMSHSLPMAPSKALAIWSRCKSLRDWPGPCEPQHRTHFGKAQEPQATSRMPRSDLTPRLQGICPDDIRLRFHSHGPRTKVSLATCPGFRCSSASERANSAESTGNDV